MGTGALGAGASLARWRRRRAYLLVALLLAAAAAFGTTAIVVSSRHTAAKLQVSTGPNGSGTSPGGAELGRGALVPAANLVSDPVFVSSTVGFALETAEHGNLAVERLARSADGGRTWRVTGSAFPYPWGFSTAQFISPEQGYVFGDSGLLVTSDGGTSWHPVQGLNGTLQRAIPLGGNVWATYTSCGTSPPGGTGSCSVGVAISTDAGSRWSDVTTTGLHEARDGGDILARWSLTSAYVLSYGVTGGGLAYTGNDGLSWQQLPDPCSQPYERADLAAPPPPAGAVSGLWLICGALTAPGADGQPKVVYRSYDDARHWQLVASTGFLPSSETPAGEIPFSGWVSQLATITPTQAWLGIQGLGVIVTDDSGATWVPVAGLSTSEPDTAVGVTFNSGVLGWAIVFRRGVWRTEDGIGWQLLDGT